MVGIRNEQDIAIVAPEGPYQQAQIEEALDAVFDLCPGGKARGLIMDFSNARGVERHSVVRVRETARHIASKAASYGWRMAIVTPAEVVADAVRVGSAVVERQGIEYQLFRSLADARHWVLERA
jgi:hypothetical protein